MLPPPAPAVLRKLIPVSSNRLTNQLATEITRSKGTIDLPFIPPCLAFHQAALHTALPHSTQWAENGLKFRSIHSDLIPRNSLCKHLYNFVLLGCFLKTVVVA